MPKFSVQHISDLSQTECDALIVFTSKDEPLDAQLQGLDEHTDNRAKYAIDADEFSAKLAQNLYVSAPESAFKRLYLIGLGQLKELDAGKWQQVLAKLQTVLKNKALKKVVIDSSRVQLSTQQHKIYTSTVAVIVKAGYLYQTSLNDKATKEQPLAELEELIFYIQNDTEQAAISAQITLGRATGEGINAARQLGNLPGNYCTPRFLAKEAKKLAKDQNKFKCSILNEKQMRELDMNCLLSVSAGSAEPARLIQLEYQGAAKDQKPIVLVGKGITFDSGGISIKPGASMDEMKYDMCGAASVMGVFHALQYLDLPLNVVGIIAASENMPSEKATKPGDVIQSMSGKTVEILNTDAEGRLVLCDALCYAQREYEPELLIDLATLTGACVIALGKHYAGLYSNRDELAQSLQTAGSVAHDRVWRMPLGEDYNKQLKSNFADLANIGGREAGSVTAACFLQNFIEEDQAWAHLDIAGVAWKGGSAKGGTGRPVAMLLEFLNQRAQS